MKKVRTIKYVIFTVILSYFAYSCKSGKASVSVRLDTGSSHYPTSRTPDSGPSRSESSGEISRDIQKVIKTALSYKGTKYKYGGTNKRGMDCSGLMFTSYESIGFTLPRVSRDQAKVGKRIYIGQLQEGDLVFFSWKKSVHNIQHVGMVTSVSPNSIRFIHASSSKGVREDELMEGYYRPYYVKATRPLD